MRENESEIIRNQFILKQLKKALMSKTVFFGKCVMEVHNEEKRIKKTEKKCLWLNLFNAILSEQTIFEKKIAIKVL